ncbi:unnamed protein product, partial [Brenthis ino]
MQPFTRGRNEYNEFTEERLVEEDIYLPTNKRDTTRLYDEKREVYEISIMEVFAKTFKFKYIFLPIFSDVEEETILNSDNCEQLVEKEVLATSMAESRPVEKRQRQNSDDTENENEEFITVQRRSKRIHRSSSSNDEIYEVCLSSKQALPKQIETRSYRDVLITTKQMPSIEEHEDMSNDVEEMNDDDTEGYSKNPCSSRDIAMNLDWTTINENLGSDHLMLKYTLRYKDKLSFTKKRNYKNANWIEYKNILEKEFNEFDFETNDIQIMYDKFIQRINLAADKAIPYIKYCNNLDRKFVPKPFWNQTLSKIVAERRLALKNLRRNPTPHNLDILEQKVTEARMLIVKIESESWHSFCSDIDENTTVMDMWRKMQWMKGLRRTKICTSDERKQKLLESLAPDFVSPNIPLLRSKNEALESPFTYSELDNTLKQKNSSPGDDNISYSIQLSACYELVHTIDELSISLTQVTYSLLSGDVEAILDVKRNLVLVIEYLRSAIQYLEVDRVNVKILEEVYAFYTTSSFFSINDTSKEGKWRVVTSKYMDDTYSLLFQLREEQVNLWVTVRESAAAEIWAARRTLVLGISVLGVVICAAPVLVLLLRHTFRTLQAFTESIEHSTQQVMIEKQKSDLLLSRMLPIPVLRRLRAQRTVPAEAFDAVTIYFSDIVGFTNIAATSTPMEIINMLNMLYRMFDDKIMQYNVYKVETIGDAYMVVSGLPQRNGNRHASEIADMSLSLMRSLEGARIPHRPDDLLRIRAGVNTGPCVAGVVGATMPRYCLFGDTINTASRMESTGEPMKIHISQTTKAALEEIGNYIMESRGVVDVQGKGPMETFWLVGKVGEMVIESPPCLRLEDYDQNVLELLIK